MPSKNKRNCSVDIETLMALRELQVKGEPDILLQLVAVFLKNSEETLKALLEQKPENRFEVIQNLAHSWKSSAYGLGAKNLGDLCSALEASAKSQSKNVEALIEALHKEYLLVQAELATLSQAK